MTTLTPPRTRSSARCLFHDGITTLDLLLAELDPRDRALFDAVLDLRSLAQAQTDAEACIHQLLLVRRLLGGRHYLAFYRVRCWAHRTLRVALRIHRAAGWQEHALPEDCARFDELLNSLLAGAGGEDVPELFQYRCAFRASAMAAH